MRARVGEVSGGCSGDSQVQRDKVTREVYATSEYPHASTRAPIPVKVRGRSKCGGFSFFFFFGEKAPGARVTGRSSYQVLN